MAKLELLTVPTTKSAVESLLSNTPKQFASPTFGEVIPLEVANLTEIPQPTGSRVFNPQSWSGYTSVKAAIGNGFISPVAGVWFIQSGIALTSGTIMSGKRYQIITFIAGDDFTNVGAASNASGVIFTATGTTPTTWTHSSVLNEITGNLAYNAAASDVQTALNATGWITSAGGVAVTIPPGTTLFFLVTFNTDGARTQMTGYAAQLVPLSIVETGTEVDGDAQTQEIQTIRVGQNAASFVILADDSTGPAMTIDPLTTGGGGLNAKYSVSLDPLPYDGSFTILVRGWESQLIPWNAPAIDTNGATGVQTFLENISANSGTIVTGAKYKIVSFATSDDFTNVGGTNVTGNIFVATGTTPTNWAHGSVLSPVAAGNVQVGTTQTGEYLIAFQGDMANTDMGTISGDADALKVIPYKLGSLSLDTPGMELLLGSAAKVDCFLDITAIPPGESAPQELLRIPISVNAAIIDPASETPQPIASYYTKAQVDALLASIVSSGGITIGNSIRIIPITNGGKIQTSNDGGSTWQDADSWTHS